MTFQIFNCRLKKGDVFPKAAKRHIATTTKQRARFARLVIVIYAQRLKLIRLFADCANTVLGREHDFIFSEAKTVFLAQSAIFSGSATNSPIGSNFVFIPLRLHSRSVVVRRQAGFTHIAKTARRCLIRPIFRSFFDLATFRASLFGNLRLRSKSAPDRVISINDFSAIGTMGCQSVFTITVFPKPVCRFFCFAFTANFGRWYGELDHAVRFFITNGLIRLERQFAALVRAASILPRISRNHNNFMALYADAACRRERAAISKQEKEASYAFS